MSGNDFTLDPRLAADTVGVIALPLCDVRLMDDARYPWLILVPRRASLVEIADLDGETQAALWREVGQAGAALRAVAPCDKLNLGALGNIVRQLHIHLVVRCEGDAAWPGPVWGHGRAERYDNHRRAALIERLRSAMRRSDRH